jgi:cGMP-dependent protein kinase
MRGGCRVANVGDSRCIAVKDEGGTLVPKPLSTDQTPYRRDERARVRKCGARVLNMDQLEGLEAIHDDWDMSLGDEVRPSTTTGTCLSGTR